MADNVHKGLVDVAADYSAIAAVNGKTVTGTRESVMVAKRKIDRVGRWRKEKQSSIVF